ncbi:hypothetical protein [Holdemanella porci]|uniref:hypothetical protein n=1 Tax=Holdemanella porci TaxID=2652276 RepID=UPI003AB501AA
MALEYEDKNEYGVVTGYHRVDNVVYDFKQGVIHFDMVNYADRSYREKEIEYEQEVKEKYLRYRELELKGNTRTPDEDVEFNGLHLDMLLVWKDLEEDYSLSKTHYTIDLTDEIRIPFYTLLSNEILDFQGGEAV